MHGGDVTFTRDHAEQACAWFAALGRKLAIDFDHQSILREDGLSPAAGWIGRLEIRADGLWVAEVEWTERARELLSAGEYRYCSPVIYWAGADNDQVMSLGPPAITNDPAMKGVPALAASLQRDERRIGTMTAMTICAARPLPTIGRLGSGVLNEPTDRGEVDTEMNPESLLTAEELALVVGFFDYAFELSGPLAIFLDQSKAMGRERWLATAAKLLDKAAPGNVAEASKVIDLLHEIAEHRQKLEAVEEPEPSIAPGGATVGRAAGGDEDAFATICRRTFNGSAALQREFGSVESFIAFRRHDAAGHVKILGKPRGVYSTTQPDRTVRRAGGIADVDDETFKTICQREWEASAALRAEFKEATAYTAFRRHDAAGHVKILGKSRGVVRG